MRLIGPHFFENAVGEAVTVNRDRYRRMTIEFFRPELMNIYL